jgi:hypothetical protein
MTKTIQIDDNGHTWHVPMQFIAEHRAKYYADKDPDTTFQEEVDYVMTDDCEGIDWLVNNMDFADYASAAVKVKTPTVLEPSSSADMSIIDTSS